MWRNSNVWKRESAWKSNSLSSPGEFNTIIYTQYGCWALWLQWVFTWLLTRGIVWQHLFIRPTSLTANTKTKNKAESLRKTNYSSCVYQLIASKSAHINFIARKCLSVRNYIRWGENFPVLFFHQIQLPLKSLANPSKEQTPWAWLSGGLLWWCSNPGANTLPLSYVA